MASLASDVRDFASRFHMAEDGREVTASLLDLLQSVPVGGKQVHDANIVATMLVHNLPVLITHNVRDFERYVPLIKVEPLAPAVTQ